MRVLHDRPVAVAHGGAGLLREGFGDGLIVLGLGGGDLLAGLLDPGGCGHGSGR